MNERWVLFKELVLRWRQVDLQLDEADVVNEIISLEKKFKVSLPEGVRTWVSFIEEVLRYKTWWFRDSKSFVMLPEHDAFSLLIQGEHDYYWAVRRSDLTLPDPPVQGYRQDFEQEGNVFVYDQQVSNSVSGFALKYLLDYHYLFNQKGGYAAHLEDGNEALLLLRTNFGNGLVIEDYQVWEIPGCIILLNGNEFSVEYTLSPSALPELVQKFAKWKYTYHGEQV